MFDLLGLPVLFEDETKSLSEAEAGVSSYTAMTGATTREGSFPPA